MKIHIFVIVGWLALIPLCQKAMIPGSGMSPAQELQKQRERHMVWAQELDIAERAAYKNPTPENMHKITAALSAVHLESTRWLSEAHQGVDACKIANNT